jgi:tRNA 2-thiouridine synthesizing protein D
MNIPIEIAILITSSPLHSSSTTAFQFLQAALNKKHQIKRVFFYQDGVYHGNQLIYSETPDLITRWQTLGKSHAIELILCAASCAKRGVMGKEQADYFEKNTHNLADGFQIASLSLWFESVLSADRVMVFGETG